MNTLQWWQSKEHIVSCLVSELDQREDSLRCSDIDALYFTFCPPSEAKWQLQGKSWIKIFLALYRIEFVKIQLVSVTAVSPAEMEYKMCTFYFLLPLSCISNGIMFSLNRVSSSHTSHKPVTVIGNSHNYHVIIYPKFDHVFSTDIVENIFFRSLPS
jgi:hypothetical protein